MTRHLLTLLLATLLINASVFGQTECELTLLRAQEEFDAGRFYSVPDILQTCLERNQNREWKQRAYLLLAETYLLLEESEQADASYLEVLRANPEFVTDESRDPIDLVYLSKKFTATPILSFYAKIGLNASLISVIHDVKISPQGNLKEDWSSRAGWQGGVGIQYHYTDRISFGGELNLFQSSFRHRTRSLFTDGNYSVDFTENQTSLQIPILARYCWPGLNLEPFAYAGPYVSVLVSDRANIVINSNVESPLLNYQGMRQRLTYGVTMGGGLRYKWNLRYLFAEVRYNAGFSNLVKPEQRYSEINQSWPYVDDDFRLNNFCLNIGYVHPLYKARKLKKARTKSVLRRIERRDDDGQ